MSATIIVICVGASLGALLRWILALSLNSLFPAIPPGTLAANILGGCLIGITAEFFLAFPEFSPNLRAFLITGFLGGLTTFSSFTLETAILLQKAEYLLACLGIFLQITCSLGAFFTGICFFRFIKKIFF